MSEPKRLKAEAGPSSAPSPSLLDSNQTPRSIVSFTTTTTSDGAHPAAEAEVRPLWRDFMRLSPEIRRQINNEVLYVGRIFPYYQHSWLPHDANGRQYEAPTIEWIKVLARMEKRLELEGAQLSSSPKAEGEEALYGQNTIVVELDKYDAFFGQYVTVGEPDDLDEEYRLFARNAYIASVQVDVSYAMPDGHDLRSLRDRVWSDPALTTEDQRLLWTHRALRTMVQLLWASAFEILTALPRLKYLEVNVENAFCPLNCCRQVEYLIENGFRLSQHPKLKTLVVSRIFGLDEVSVIRDALRLNFGERMDAGLTVMLRNESETGTWLKDEI